ncbi:MAG: hypothetical protein N4A72_00815 [Bacteroidales bacterium]|nr:hypothetical protein [Bacteroidales bacterium]
MAISGIFIAMVFFFYPEYMIDKLDLYILDHNKNVLIIKDEINYLDKKMRKDFILLEMIEDEINANEDNLNYTFNVTNDIKYIEKKYLSYKKESDSIKHLLIEMLKNDETSLLLKSIGNNINQMGYEEKIISHMEEKINRFYRYKTVGITFGIMLSFLGFLFWYSRSQKFIDERMKSEIIDNKYKRHSMIKNKNK